LYKGGNCLVSVGAAEMYLIDVIEKRKHTVLIIKNIVENTTTKMNVEATCFLEIVEKVTHTKYS
jgi:hypothetical protein